MASPYRPSGVAVDDGETSSAIAHRKDIDGMRGVAVVAVVLFHAFPSYAPGGFIGVDVFFVISGYLITGIIYKEIESSTFSFIDFYRRRIRRIFPALIVVLIAAILLGVPLLLPEEFRQLSKHAASAALFIANIMFWRESGYFDSLAQAKPLLHLWSLSVEEQFYIIWPLALTMAFRRRLNIALMTAVVAIFSFCVNLLHVYEHSTAAAFYSPASRFWELMIGALIVFAPPVPPRLRNPASIIGALFILAAISLVNQRDNFPGWIALLPTVGAALVISAGQNAVVNRVALQNAAIVFIGLISYPFYLWHWPLLSFATIADGFDLPFETRVLIIAISFSLAMLTFWAVEIPIRYGKVSRERTPIALGLILLAIGTVGVAFTALHIAPANHLIVANSGETVSEGGNRAYFGYQLKHYFSCTPASLVKHTATEYAPARCLQSKKAEKKDVAIIGDSHAEDMFLGMADHFKNKNVVKYIQSGLSAPVSPDFDAIFAYVVADKNIRTVFLTGYWAIEIKNIPHGTLEATMAKAIKELTEAGKSVYLVTDRPNFSFDPTLCKYARPKFLLVGSRPRCSLPRSIFDAQRAPYYSALSEAVARAKGAHFIDTAAFFCDHPTSCSMERNHILLFRDQNHLTIGGSRALVDWMAPQLKIPSD